MSRPLPCCALYGESLARRERVLVRWGSLPGAPEVGWHQDCSRRDRAFLERVPGRDGTDIIATIEARDRNAPLLMRSRVIRHSVAHGEKGGPIYGNR